MDVFREEKFELLILTEKKLKRNGKVSWCVVNGIIGGFQEMERAREGVAILLNYERHRAVMDFGCISLCGEGTALAVKMLKKGTDSG